MSNPEQSGMSCCARHFRELFLFGGRRRRPRNIRTLLNTSSPPCWVMYKGSGNTPALLENYSWEHFLSESPHRPQPSTKPVQALAKFGPSLTLFGHI